MLAQQVHDDRKVGITGDKNEPVDGWFVEIEFFKGIQADDQVGPVLLAGYVRGFADVKVIIYQLFAQFRDGARITAGELHRKYMLFGLLLVFFQDDILQQFVQVQNPGHIFQIYIQGDKFSHCLTPQEG